MLKSADEVRRNLETASPMELAVSANEMMAEAIRVAVDQNDRSTLVESLALLAENVAMMQRWLQESKH
jgi:hypothetical protein